MGAKKYFHIISYEGLNIGCYGAFPQTWLEFEWSDENLEYLIDLRDHWTRWIEGEDV